jgi:hypothetical protein
VKAFEVEFLLVQMEVTMPKGDVVPVFKRNDFPIENRARLGESQTIGARRV